MAHEIDTTTGKAACMVTGTPAWHRLGVVIEKAATSAEALKLAVLDWNVEQFPVYAALPDDQYVRCEDRVANVRSDTKAVLGVVSRWYRPFQNQEAFDFMDALVGDKLAMYHTAGSLRGGRRIWMLAKIPAEYRVGEDIVEPYVLLTNTHDGTQTLRMIPTTIRVVCQNTLNLAMAWAGRQGISIAHHQTLDARVEEAREKLGIVVQRHEQFGEEMKAMAARKLKAEEITEYFDELFPTKVKPEGAQSGVQAGTDGAGLLDQIITVQTENHQVTEELLKGHFAATEAEAKRNKATLELVLDNFESERNTLPETKHSAWSAYNSVSEWADHQRRVSGKTELDKADSRLNSIWFGAGNDIKQKAFQTALTLATSA